MLRRFIVGGFLSVLAAFSITAAVAAPAGASTPGCTKGAFAGYCGTQTDNETTPMSWDVFRQAAKVGQPLIAFTDSDTDPAVDFVALHPGTSSVGAAKMFIYAPGGKVSNLCVSEPDQGAALVLRVCNGSAWQVFTAKPSTAPARSSG
jgi:hypothetical protein